MLVGVPNCRYGPRVRVADCASSGVEAAVAIAKKARIETKRRIMGLLPVSAGPRQSGVGVQTPARTASESGGSIHERFRWRYSDNASASKALTRGSHTSLPQPRETISRDVRAQRERDAFYGR